MRNKVRTVECASIDCARKFETRSRQSVQYCSNCRIKRRRQRQLLYLRKLQEYLEQDLDQDHPNAAELYFQRKLARAEYSILKDAGPEEEAFRPGSRLARHEVYDLLKFESIAENSILIHNRSGRLHRVRRSDFGRLVLDPPIDMTNGHG